MLSRFKHRSIINFRDIERHCSNDSTFDSTAHDSSCENVDCRLGCRCIYTCISNFQTSTKHQIYEIWETSLHKAVNDASINLRQKRLVNCQTRQVILADEMWLMGDLKSNEIDREIHQRIFDCGSSLEWSLNSEIGRLLSHFQERNFLKLSLTKRHNAKKTSETRSFSVEFA